MGDFTWQNNRVTQLRNGWSWGFEPATRGWCAYECCWYPAYLFTAVGGVWCLLGCYFAGRDNVEIKDPLILNERILTIFGLWPEKRVRARFAMWMVYMGLHSIMQYWDLYDHKGNFDLMVLNMLESTLTTSTLISMMIFKSNKRLGRVIIEMKGYIADVSLLEEKEKRLYRYHTNVAYYFGNCTIIVVIFTGFTMYTRPLIRMLRGYLGHDNSTLTYTLPFRAHLIFDYTTDARIYSLLYLYECAVVCVSFVHATVVSFIINTVLHTCGRLSVLSYRIRKMSTKSSRAFNIGIKQAVVTHLQLMESFEELNETFSVILLLELLSCCGRLGLAMFVVLTKLGIDFGAVLIYSFYVCAQVGWLFLFCYIGEQAICESQKVGDAFYEIDWPDVGNNDRKSLLICIVNGYRTMYLTAAKIYIFSLFGFTSIMKTSMGCLSMLQASM